jgi:hypothetical protein
VAVEWTLTWGSASQRLTNGEWPSRAQSRHGARGTNEQRGVAAEAIAATTISQDHSRPSFTFGESGVPGGLARLCLKRGKGVLRRPKGASPYQPSATRWVADES